MKPVIRPPLSTTGEDLGSALSRALAGAMTRRIRRRIARTGSDWPEAEAPAPDRAATRAATLAWRGDAPSAAAFDGRASGEAADSED
ncbi:MAG: hypothetical protein ACK4PN_13905 [Allorhizobium sp.]